MNEAIKNAELELEQAEQALEEFNARYFETGGDVAEINIPRAKRHGPAIDLLLDRHKALTKARNRARHRLTTARTQAAAPARAAAKAAAEDAADLRSEHAGKTEVLWSLTGRWLPVLRWNKKSVSVDMAGTRELIPWNQVGGAR